jgi:hypothetical protein
VDASDRRIGDRLLIGTRPAVQLRHTRAALFGQKTDVIDGQLMQVSVTGALVVTPHPIRGVGVGSVIDLLIRGRKSTATVRRIDAHHDMVLYGLELGRIDAWLQALIDRAANDARGDLEAAWLRTR